MQPPAKEYQKDCKKRIDKLNENFEIMAFYKDTVEDAIEMYLKKEYIL